MPQYFPWTLSGIGPSLSGIDLGGMQGSLSGGPAAGMGGGFGAGAGLGVPPMFDPTQQGPTPSPSGAGGPARETPPAFSSLLASYLNPQFGAENYGRGLFGGSELGSLANQFTQGYGGGQMAQEAPMGLSRPAPAQPAPTQQQGLSSLLGPALKLGGAALGQLVQGAPQGVQGTQGNAFVDPMASSGFTSGQTWGMDASGNIIPVSPDQAMMFPELNRQMAPSSMFGPAQSPQEITGYSGAPYDVSQPLGGGFNYQSLLGPALGLAATGAGQINPQLGQALGAGQSAYSLYQGLQGGLANGTPTSTVGLMNAAGTLLNQVQPGMGTPIQGALGFANMPSVQAGLTAGQIANMAGYTPSMASGGAAAGALGAASPYLAGAAGFGSSILAGILASDAQNAQYDVNRGLARGFLGNQAPNFLTALAAAQTPQEQEKILSDLNLAHTARVGWDPTTRQFSGGYEYGEQVTPQLNEQLQRILGTKQQLFDAAAAGDQQAMTLLHSLAPQGGPPGVGTYGSAGDIIASAMKQRGVEQVSPGQYALMSYQDPMWGGAGYGTAQAEAIANPTPWYMMDPTAFYSGYFNPNVYGGAGFGAV